MEDEKEQIILWVKNIQSKRFIEIIYGFVGKFIEMEKDGK